MMIIEKQTKEHGKIKSFFFEKTKQVLTHTDYDLFKDLSKDLNQILQTSFVGFYIYNHWNHSYNLVSSSDPKLSFLHNIDPYIENIREMQIEQDVIDGDAVFYDAQDTQNLYVLALNQKDEGSTTYCIICFNTKSTSSTLIFLHEEIERLTEVYFSVQQNEWKQARDDFLKNLSLRVFSTPRRAKVLENIVRSLQEIYPSYEYYILLSQDYDDTCDLPIKELEFNETTSKHGSNEAFLSGQIQIENGLHGTHVYSPLRGNQGVYGVIEIVASSKTYFPDQEIGFIHEFSLIAGQALENVTLYQSSITLVSDLKLINSATQKLNANANLPQLIAIVKQQISNACKARQIGFVFIEKDSKELFELSPESTPFFQTEKGLSVVRFLLEQMKVKQEVFTGKFTKHYPNTTFESVMLIPMIQSGEVHGAVVIMHERESYFSFENFKLMQSLIQHFTLSITNTILKNKLKKAVITDYLTKLYSRNHLDEMIKKHMETDEYGSLILFDIDDFKQVNDTYGHFIGDELIIQVANIMKENIAEQAIPTRWGGEELAIYLPNVLLDEGLKVAEKIRVQVEHESEPEVTLSCGISMWTKTSKRDATISDLFIRADKALYVAKEGGKNRIATQF